MPNKKQLLFEITMIPKKDNFVRKLRKEKKIVKTYYLKLIKLKLIKKTTTYLFLIASINQIKKLFCLH
jgi:hypothetical protein